LFNLRIERNQNCNQLNLQHIARQVRCLHLQATRYLFKTLPKVCQNFC
jgi:hypothetical protein